jgi:hypothetical protein
MKTHNSLQNGCKMQTCTCGGDTAERFGTFAIVGKNARLARLFYAPIGS